MNMSFTIGSITGYLCIALNTLMNILISMTLLVAFFLDITEPCLVITVVHQPLLESCLYTSIFLFYLF